VCLNLALTRYVRGLFERNGAAVEVLPFFDLCARLLGEEVDHSVKGSDYYEGITRRVLEGPVGEVFDCLLVDEGQDLKGDQYRVLMRVAGSREIKIARDRGQNIFDVPDAELEEILGVDVGSITARLPEVHRASAEIMRVACELGGRPPAGPVAGRNKARFVPEVRTVGAEELLPALIARIRSLVFELDVPPAEIGVLYTSQPRGSARPKGLPSFCEPLVDALAARRVEVNFFSQATARKLTLSMEEPTVKMASVFASKGLDFQVVLLVDVESALNGPRGGGPVVPIEWLVHGYEVHLAAN
jgi:superfamily I DNA/RNA helicase